MPNYIDNLNLIDPKGSVVNALLQDRETLSLATNNKNDILILNNKIDDAVIALTNTIKNNIVYVPTSTLNIDNTGATDCASILSNVSNNVGFKAGTYLIDSDCVINAQIVMAGGAKFNVTTGHTLTINGQILAGRYTIFEGNGNIVVDETKQEFGYPEWFADDFTKTLDTFHYVKLARKVYTLETDLILNKSNTKIEGTAYSTNETGDCTILNFRSTARIRIGTHTSTNIADFPRNITLSKLFIVGKTNLDCISIYGVVRPLIEQCYIWTDTAFSGITFYRAIGGTCRDVYVQSVGMSGTFMGYRFTDEVGTGSAGARAASVWLINCTYADTNPQNGNTYGFYIGKHLSDVYMTNCEVAEANIGICFDSLENSYSVDFLIEACDFDSTRTNAIRIYNCSKGMISFNNCYAANKPNASGNITMQIIDSACQVVLNGLQIILTKNGANAITADSNSVALLSDISILNNDGISNTTALSTSSTNVKGTYIFNGNIVTV